MKLNLAVTYGSRTCEHDVSIISGLQAADAARGAGYQVTLVYIDRGGAWYAGEALWDMALYRDFDPAKVTRVLPLGEDGKLVLIRYPEEKKVLFGSGRAVVAACDAVLPVMHGMNGEDGTLQGMLEMLDVPYASAGVLGSSVGMDKIAMKMLFTGCGFPVLPGEWVDRSDWAEHREDTLARLERALPYPVYVKPANLGSSIGISRADDRAGLAQALDVAAAFDRRLLVEKGVADLKEVNCSVMGYAGNVRASVTEMPVRWDEFLTFDEKYMRSAKGGSKGMQSLSRQVPAPISDELTARIQALSVDIFKALDCKGVVRIDFILDGADGALYVEEINTIPGSLAFYLWEASGVSFQNMIDKMVECALKAHADKRQSVFSYKSDILNRQGGGTKGKLAK
ncbi:MAG: D-alanine--D-alanine ligase family protein [Christensenellaceae bacterium]|nr:D-alanine--D-alanine ligase family protein [Christensenellaceae bacterium]MEA5070239.1 D-alanine--D-alanine ligase family protein [Christensenellaceae bacterium]